MTNNQATLTKAIEKAIDGNGFTLVESDLKPVVGYEGRYWVTVHGHILGRRGWIVQYKDRKGYWRVTLNKMVNGSWKGQQTLVHRIVAKAFIPNPDNKPQINHINGVRDDNRLENLEWATARENVQDGFNRGRKSWNKDMKSTANMTLQDLARELPRLQTEAKALWGDDMKITGHTVDGDTMPLGTSDGWQHHLQQMVVAEDPIEYLKENM